jgi:hypothetical protein
VRRYLGRPTFAGEMNIWPEFPPHAKAASFTVSNVMEKITATAGAAKQGSGLPGTAEVRTKSPRRSPLRRGGRLENERSREEQAERTRAQPGRDQHLRPLAYRR